MTTNDGAPPRIERLRVANYRALREFELTRLTPLTVLIGPNGSGKSTVLDVFAFLADCFGSGLRYAWKRRGGARGLKSLGGVGPVAVEVSYRERPKSPLITYRLEINEHGGNRWRFRIGSAGSRAEAELPSSSWNTRTDRGGSPPENGRTSATSESRYR